jgi:hypothetical protein
MRYFAELSNQVKNLTSVGRTKKSLITALDDVEQFESLDTKAFYLKSQHSE